MKNFKRIGLLLVLAASAIVVSSCDKKDKKVEVVDVVDNQMSMELPNKSDIAFEKALMALDKSEYKLAGEHVDHGIMELKEEAKSKGSTLKNKLDNSIKQLTGVSEQLKKGIKIDAEALRNLIVNAEINVAHDYLVTEDTYILTEPEKVNDSRLHKVLDHNLKSLEAETSKLTGDAKKEGEKLQAEGKKLNDDYKAWKKRAKEHIKKTEAHFKKHQPEFVYETYWGLYPIQ